MKSIFLVLAIITLTLGGCALFPSTQTNQTNNPYRDDSTTPTKVGTTASSQLNLSGQNLKQIPIDVFGQTNLEELNVSNNQLSGSIQAEIRQLKNLVVLDASNNQMTGVPAEIGQLTNLRVLDLSNNQLTGLPYELGNLQNLQTLNLSGNNYSQMDLDIILEKLPENVKVIR